VFATVTTTSVVSAARSAVGGESFLALEFKFLVEEQNLVRAVFEHDMCFIGVGVIGFHAKNGCAWRGFKRGCSDLIGDVAFKWSFNRCFVVRLICGGRDVCDANTESEYCCTRCQQDHRLSLSECGLVHVCFLYLREHPDRNKSSLGNAVKRLILSWLEQGKNSSKIQIGQPNLGETPISSSLQGQFLRLEVS
jgi:hypothetical protein